MNMETSYTTRPKRANKLSPVVRALGEIHYEGNVYPHAWFQHPRLRLGSGAPNLVAIVLLADLVYWLRPVVERDEATGEVVSVRDKFSGERYQARYASIAKRFGLSKRQIQDAAAFLDERGIIKRDKVARVETAAGDVLGNVVFLTPVPAAIRDLNTIYLPDDEQAPITFESSRYTENGDEPPTFPDSAPPTTLERNRYHGQTSKGTRSKAQWATPERNRFDAASGDISKTPSETPSDISIKTTTDTESAETAVAFLDINSEASELVALVAALGITYPDAQSIVAEAMRADDGTDRIRRAAAWWPTSQQAKDAKNPGAAFRSAVRQDWAKAAALENEAREREARQTQAARRYVAEPAKRTRKHFAEAGDLASLRVVAPPSAQAEQADLDGIYSTLSPCAIERLHAEAVARASINAAPPVRAVLRDSTPNSELKGAAGMVLRAARNSILRERAAAPILVNGRAFYDAIDARDAQINLDFA